MNTIRQDVMTPEDAAIQRKIAEEREHQRQVGARKARAVLHCFFVFLMCAAAALGVILCASIFGWQETAVGAAFLMAASITAFIYIQNA